jgi:hypothetical protein
MAAIDMAWMKSIKPEYQNALGMRFRPFHGYSDARLQFLHATCPDHSSSVTWTPCFVYCLFQPIRVKNLRDFESDLSWRTKVFSPDQGTPRSIFGGGGADQGWTAVRLNSKGLHEYNNDSNCVPYSVPYSVPLGLNFADTLPSILTF